MEPVKYYRIYRKTTFDWVSYVNRCHKWTQTSTNCSSVISKAKEVSSNLLIQAEVNRVIQLYNLTGSRDLNTKKAIADVINHQFCLKDDKKMQNLLQRKIGRTVTHRRYYNKKKNIKLKLKETDMSRRKGSSDADESPCDSPRVEQL